MSIGFIFWLLMLLRLIFGVYVQWPGVAGGPRIQVGGSLIDFILFFLLGWATFGFIIKG